MVGKASFVSMLVGIGVFALVTLMAGTYIQQNPNKPQSVLGTTYSSSDVTKAGAVSSAAYAKCTSNGGFVTTARRGSGFYNVCNFADDMNCELYALYAGQCPVGGVKTVGYSTTPQVFCALRGGHPQGSNNGQCKMPDGKVCSTDSVYQGTCN